MANLELPDVLHDLLKSVAEAVDVTPGQLASRIIFGSLKNLPLHPDVTRQIIEQHNRTPQHKKAIAPPSSTTTKTEATSPPAGENPGTINLSA